MIVCNLWSSLHSQDVKGGVVREGVVTYWAVLTRENGALEVSNVHL